MINKTCFLYVAMLFFGIVASVKGQESQSDDSLLEKKIFRLNVLSPGVGLELRTGKFSSLSFNTGITNSWLYPDMGDTSESGRFEFVYSIEPFLGIDQKFFYNLQKRLDEGKSTAYNSGNYFSLRFLSMGESITGNINRRNDYQFMLIPSWGFQRSYNRLHLLFDIGPVFIFDGKGNQSLFPVFFRINLGYNF